MSRWILWEERLFCECTCDACSCCLRKNIKQAVECDSAVRLDIILSIWSHKINIKICNVFDAVPLVEFMYLLVTHMPGESYWRWLGSLLLCLGNFFPTTYGYFNSLVCWFVCWSFTEFCVQFCHKINGILQNKIFNKKTKKNFISSTCWTKCVWRRPVPSYETHTGSSW